MVHYENSVVYNEASLIHYVHHGPFWASMVSQFFSCFLYLTFSVVTNMNHCVNKKRTNGPLWANMSHYGHYVPSSATMDHFDSFFFQIIFFSLPVSLLCLQWTTGAAWRRQVPAPSYLRVWRPPALSSPVHFDVRVAWDASRTGDGNRATVLCPAENGGG